MPSKGGRPSDNAAPVLGPPVASRPAPIVRTRAQWDAAGFTAAGMAQPLRRGVDVERFNDLSVRVERLAPEELEELYRYRLRRVNSRLRQLARARTRGNEAAIRSALEALDLRLEELRASEARRQDAGLATGYEIELDQRQAAVDYLLELTRRKQPGLVAGCDIPPEQPAGDVALPPIALPRHARRRTALHPGSPITAVGCTRAEHRGSGQPRRQHPSRPRSVRDR